MHWICSAATLRGDRTTNQDQYVVVDGAAAVLDGATSWLHTDQEPESRDGGWYTRVLGAALAVRLPGHGTPLDVILEAAIADVRGTYGLKPGDSPYSTATLTRWNAKIIDLLVLGDTPALVHYNDGTNVLVADERLAATAPAERDAYRDHLREGRGFDDDLADLIATLQRTERHSFNQPGGFWVAEAEPAAAGHAVCRTLPVDEVDALTLMTDGAAASVTDYELTDWAGMHSELSRHGIAAWLHRTHLTEETDPDGRRWPRTKKHDDKTALHLAKLFR
ncbi:hypothetical protein [Micromonospora aurantiaca (nom. illeg.)]|uniref:hypothetical protein n=1 Tax=Micromonospora aurantiaca (nom. illeg.) TaxID=47850 RepID=UPI0033D9B08A